MPLGTKWRIEFKTDVPIGDKFLEALIIEGIGSSDDRETPITHDVKITCLKELTDKEYKEHDEMKKMEKYFRLLGLNPDASNKEITDRYKMLIKTYCSDTTMGTEAKEVFEGWASQINVAYTEIKKERGIL